MDVENGRLRRILVMTRDAVRPLTGRTMIGGHKLVFVGESCRMLLWLRKLGCGIYNNRSLLKVSSFDIHELACLIFFCYDGVGDTSESGGRSRNREGASSRMDVDSEDEVEVLFNTMSNSVTFDPPEDMEVDPVEHGAATSTAPPLDTTSRTVVCPPAPQRRNPIPLPSSSSDQQQQQRRSAATAPHRVIDLDAYHDGPFRGALARAVEASRQTEQRRQHRQIEEEPRNRDRSNPAPTATNRSQSRQSNRTDTARAQVSRTTYAIL